MPSLTHQLESGIRQVELDIHYDILKKDLTVKHFPFFDGRTNYNRFAQSLFEIRDFANNNDHDGIFVLIEPKGLYYTFSKYYFELLEETIRLAGFKSIASPGSAQANQKDFKNKVVFILLDSFIARDFYTEKKFNLLYPVNGEDDLFFNIDDPLEAYNERLIRGLVLEGKIVRTRAYKEGDTQEKNDRRLDSAIISDAQIISINFSDMKRIERIGEEL
jgi:hypothetical protein